MKIELIHFQNHPVGLHIVAENVNDRNLLDALSGLRAERAGTKDNKEHGPIFRLTICPRLPGKEF